MNLSPNEAEEELAVIQRMIQKTRHSFASSGAYIFLMVTGIVWLIGFLSTQFLAGLYLDRDKPAWHRYFHPARRPDGPARPWTLGDHFREARQPLLAVPGLLRHRRHRHRPAYRREAGDHVHHPVHHDRPAGYGSAAFFLLRLVDAADHRSCPDRLLPVARHFLPMDGDPGRRRDDRPRPLHPLEVVNPWPN
jgi:hypothetical protein